MPNWKPTTKATRGAGPLLLCAGQGDPVFVGYQDPDSGRWFTDPTEEVHPRFFCPIPQFDAEDPR